MLTSLAERDHLFDDRLHKLGDQVQETQARVKATGVEWASINWLSAVMGKRGDLFNKQAQQLTQLYTLQSQFDAFNYAKYLMQFLSMELNDLSNEVARAAGTIEEASKSFAGGIDARLADTGQDDLKKQVVGFYKPAVVKDFVKSLVRDKGLQTKQTTAVRQALTGLLGDNLTFTSFNVRIPLEKFKATLESACEQNASDAHNTYIAESRDRTRILGVSVIDRLNREYGGNPEALRSYVIGILSHAKNYVRFNGNEEGKRGPGTFGVKVSGLTIILPDSQELPEFREKLRAEFLQNAQTAAKEITTSTSRQSEITLVTLTNLFPARYLEDVAFLKDCYHQRTAGANGDQARFELHTEGDGTQFPDLFMPEADPKRYLAHLLIAKGIGLVQSLDDPETGVAALYLLDKDERGVDREPMRLGKDFNEAWVSPNAEASDALATAVSHALGSSFLHQSRRDELSGKGDSRTRHRKS